MHCVYTLTSSYIKLTAVRIIMSSPINALHNQLLRSLHLYTSKSTCINEPLEVLTKLYYLLCTQVGMKLLWSSRNQKFIGHAMSHDELLSLCDVYKTLSPDY